MKRIKCTLFALVALFIGTATAHAQKLINEDLSHLGSFERIDASVGWEVTFTQSNTSSINVSYSESIADRVRIEVKNGRLILGLNNQKNNNRPKKVTLRATISAPSLRAINVTTGAEIKFASPLNISGNLSIDATTGADVEGLVLTAEGFNCDVTTGASVEAKIDVTKASIDCTTGSDAKISGQANTAILDCTTGADINAKELEVQYGNCDATTAGDITITIKERAKVHASTGGDITVYGKPREIEGKIRGINFK